MMARADRRIAGNAAQAAVILSSYIEWCLTQSAQSALALLDTRYVSRSVGGRLFQKGLQN